MNRVAIVSCVVLATSTAGAQTAVDWKAVESAIGRPAVVQPGDIHRFNFPRGDMQVTAAGVQIKPALALGGWVAFKAMPGGGALAMGDLVLAESEVDPVIGALQAGGVEQTAIHHHILNESPRVIYVHVHAHGDAVKIAQAVRSAVAVTKIPPPAPAPASPPAIALDTTEIARILGRTGRGNGGVYQVSAARSETIRENGMEVPASMGLATAMNFQPTGNGRAAITGDFVLLGSEVNPVIQALRANGIAVTSLHSHMLMEEPRLFFMHFWANDDALKLARGLRAALDRTKSK
jgi:hypothetical protein